MKVPTTVI
uniref:Uncharacterized protein n=1 Tax=Arundo donax TaxID=35708 RepID=A0A0A8YYB0_ARUDO